MYIHVYIYIYIYRLDDAVHPQARLRRAMERVAAVQADGVLPRQMVIITIIIMIIIVRISIRIMNVYIALERVAAVQADGVLPRCRVHAQFARRK